MNANIGGVLYNSHANGEGTRFVVFMGGCNHRCEDCQNRMLWEQRPEDDMNLNNLYSMIDHQIPLITGVTLSGGDPFVQPVQAALIARHAHEMGLDVWTYTGYTLEQIEKISKADIGFKELLDETDVLVDGKFIPSLCDKGLEYRGSSNQRIIRLRNLEKVAV